MTTTTIDNETDFFTILSEELAIECETPVDCNNEATWCIKKFCCGHMALVCDQCRIKLEQWLIFHKAYKGYNCVVCKAENFDYVWTPLS